MISINVYLNSNNNNIILFKGEAASGKSSLINLLLEADILPTSNIKCTQTVCEIRKSKDGRKKAISFGVNGGKISEIDISTKEGIEKLRMIITYEDDYGDNPYDKIEIYWPTEIIEVGYQIILNHPYFTLSNLDCILTTDICNMRLDSSFMSCENVLLNLYIYVFLFKM